MRPVLEKPKNTKIKVIYSIIILICIIVISIAVYLQFFTEEKIGVIFGITDQNKDYAELESNFNSLFTNDLEILDDTQISVTKIEQNDIIYSKFNKEVQKDDYTINVAIPYINIDDDAPKKFNEEIQNAFKLKTESVLLTTDEKIVYTVNYKAYIQNDILSLVIKSELKENDSKQRIIVQTYNYNLKEKREEKLEEIFNLKSISSIYNIRNSNQYFFGKDGHIYVIYAYGNDDFTSEMDLVIF